VKVNVTSNPPKGSWRLTKFKSRGSEPIPIRVSKINRGRAKVKKKISEVLAGGGRKTP